MTAASMNLFLKNLFENSSDYKSLTQRQINAAYIEHSNIDSLTQDDGRLLKEMTEIMFHKMMAIDDNSESSEKEISSDVTKSHFKKSNISNSEDSDSNLKNSKSEKVNQISDDDNNLENIGDDKKCSGSDIDSVINKESDVSSIASDQDNKNVRVVIPNKNKRKSRSPSSISQSDSNGSSKVSNQAKKKRKKKVKKDAGADVGLMMLAADGSSDEEITINQLKSQINRDKTKKKKSVEEKSIKVSHPKEKAVGKSDRLKHIEKIARTSGVLPVGAKYSRTFENCENEEDRIKVIKKLLRDAGMDGKISMEKAEVLKLKKEAAELDTDNILNSSGRGVRNVNSIFSRHQKQTEPIDRPPLKNRLKNLRDIIDSDSD